jgi:LacI family transcriptional regulator
VDEAVAARFAEATPPDGILVGSTTAAMSSIAGAERSGRILGQDFDVVAKEAIALLRRFRRQTIIIKEDVGRAGEFLARALVAEIEKRPIEARQGLESPTKVDWGDAPRTGGKT